MLSPTDTFPAPGKISSGKAGVRVMAILRKPCGRFLALLRRAGDGHIRGAQPLIDGVIIVLSFFVTYLIRYNGDLSRDHLLQFAFWVPVLVVGRLLFLHSLSARRFLWRYVCLSDVIGIARSLLWITLALILLRWFYPTSYPEAYWLQLPLGIIIPEYLLSLWGVLTVRSICRIAQERSDRTARSATLLPRRVLLYGAGRAGVMLAHELASHGALQVIGFVDDDLQKKGTVIAGLRVLGTGDALESLVCGNQADEVFISIASASPAMLARIVTRCRAVPIKTRIVPSVEEIVAGRVNISHVREIHIEDLLGRTSVTVGEFGPYARTAYAGKRILVTGAGGSIGSELSRQVLLLQPSRLAILDKDENSIFDLENELKMRDPKAPVETFIADMKVPERISAVLAEFQPQVVLHAAAHKHVPLMEKHPCEAVFNNIMGLKNLLEACRQVSIERFVFISSDKAVNPTNVMGATKRAGEKLLSLYTANGSMRAASVRFGNVLGSRGSVLPTFQRQIEKGGPVTITHPDIVRFFMTIPEAVQLVLRAGSLARYNEIFVLDMGNPRRVLDLARQMIELAGLEPGKDIPIIITGLRPGEKMEEELAGPGELLCGTRFEKILEIPPSTFDEAGFLRNLDVLIKAARKGNSHEVISTLTGMNLGYQPLTTFHPPPPSEATVFAQVS